MDNREWIYGFLVKIHDGRTFIIPENSGCFRKSPYIPYRYEVIPETVGQFAGVKDRNQKDIYESDIVQLYTYDNFSKYTFKGNYIRVGTKKIRLEREKKFQHCFL